MSTFGLLSANGIKDADKLTEAVGNAVAVFGGGAKEYSSVALAFSQAMAAGALHAQDWNQIINASPQLAGGLRKELIKLNPTLGNDFKGAGVLIGMTVAVAGLMVVAKNVAPAMTAGANGFIAFGAAVLIAAAGIAILSLAAVNLANAGPLAIGCMVGMVAAIAGLALGAGSTWTGIDSRRGRSRCLWCSYITGFNRQHCWQVLGLP